VVLIQRTSEIFWRDTEIYIYIYIYINLTDSVAVREEYSGFLYPVNALDTINCVDEVLCSFGRPLYSKALIFGFFKSWVLCSHTTMYRHENMDISSRFIRQQGLSLHLVTCVGRWWVQNEYYYGNSYCLLSSHHKPNVHFVLRTWNSNNASTYVLDLFAHFLTEYIWSSNHLRCQDVLNTCSPTSIQQKYIFINIIIIVISIW
jgi:hypothetical protein